MGRFDDEMDKPLMSDAEIRDPETSPGRLLVEQCRRGQAPTGALDWRILTHIVGTANAIVARWDDDEGDSIGRCRIHVARGLSAGWGRVQVVLEPDPHSTARAIVTVLVDPAHDPEETSAPGRVRDLAAAGLGPVAEYREARSW